MVVHQPGRLHVGVDDGGANEGEAALFQVLGEGVRNLRLAGHVAHGLAPAVEGRAADEGPDVGVEGAEFLLHLEERQGVLAHAVDLQPVADDAGVGEALFKLRVGQLGAFNGIKIMEQFLVVIAFL